MELYEAFLNFVELYGALWTFLELYGTFFELHGTLLNFITIYSFLWSFMKHLIQKSPFQKKGGKLEIVFNLSEACKILFFVKYRNMLKTHWTIYENP